MKTRSLQPPRQESSSLKPLSEFSLKYGDSLSGQLTLPKSNQKTSGDELYSIEKIDFDR